MKRPILTGAALALAAAPAAAIFINAWQPVPLERLFRNVSEHVRQNPKDAQGHYTLGRLHSLAFARSMPEARVKEEPGKLPGFPPYESIQVQPQNAKPSEAALKHLLQSIRSYTAATELDPKRSLYWLGLGWMLEHGAPHADRVPAPWLKEMAKKPETEWLDRSVEAYRKAYNLDYEKDLKRGGLGPTADTSIALEAGEGLLRIWEKRRPEAAEQARVKETVAKLSALPRAVTPVIFPLDGQSPLSALVGRSGRVDFDLAGDGRAERWPWVTDRAGILVWDPERTGRVRSGVQLFGSVTWSMFWKHGYEPLAALDDNRDGWLSGRELRGLSVWVDADGDAVSDAGEVKPISAYRVARLAVAPEGTGREGPYHSRGLEFADGRQAPTYDWTPVSTPVAPGR